jgi:hypothetical protein
MIESPIFSYGASLLIGSDNTLSENEERREEFFFLYPATLHVFIFFGRFEDLE